MVYHDVSSGTISDDDHHRNQAIQVPSVAPVLDDEVENEVESGNIPVFLGMSSRLTEDDDHNRVLVLLQAEQASSIVEGTTMDWPC